MKEAFYFIKGIIYLLIVIFGIFAFITLSPLKCSVIKYNGHDMLQYKQAEFTVSVCHSPTCKKCYQIYD